MFFNAISGKILGTAVMFLDGIIQSRDKISGILHAAECNGQTKLEEGTTQKNIRGH